MAFRTQPPSDNLKGGELRTAKNGYKLYQDWTSGRLPRVLVMSIQHATPYFDDSYAVNSANVGPYGDAIIQELIPAIEKQFRGIGQGWARSVYGGSTGGWESLASQVFYPDFYNGAWVFCPDVVDFRAYMTMNLYDDKNAFWIESPYARVPRPSVRQPDGLVLSTMEQMNRYELVQGTHSRSGEQLDTWQAVFSSVGDDGYPKPIFNKRTGEIDHEVAKYWKEHYDLSAIMQRDWKTLGPKLEGKLHLYVGEADTFYLDRAVHLLKDFLESTTDPYYHGTFDFGVRKPHCYPGEFDPGRRSQPALLARDGQAHGADRPSGGGSRRVGNTRSGRGCGIVDRQGLGNNRSGRRLGKNDEHLRNCGRAALQGRVEDVKSIRTLAWRARTPNSFL